MPAVIKVEVAGLEPATPCSQGRRACHCATPRNWLWRKDRKLQLALVTSQALRLLNYARISMFIGPRGWRSVGSASPPLRGLDLR